MLRSRVVDFFDTSRCVESKVDFKCYNRSCDELFGIEDINHSPYSLNPIYTSSQVEPYLPLTITPITSISQHVDMDVDDHHIDKLLSLSDTLFLEESLD